MQLNSEQKDQSIGSSPNGSKPPVVCSTGYENVIFNENALSTMDKMPKIVDVVMTSPPYNMTERTDSYNGRYDVYSDKMNNDEYLKWTTKIFNGYDKVLKENGVIIYNFSYSHENPFLPYAIINEIHNNTEMTIADTFFWKKDYALPLSTSPTKLTRYVEFCFVIVRKKELYSFNTNKQVKSVNEKTGQSFYEIFPNIIDAKNNDGSNDLNKATFSTEFVRKCLRMYAKPGSVIYDSFMGTGTTAEACIIEKMTYVGSELSEEQCKYAEKRLGIRISQPTLF